MIRLSASAIKDYLSCPKKYYFRRYYRSLSIPTDALSIGSAVHDTLEKYSDNKEKALEHAKKSAIEYNLSADSIDRVLSSVINFFEEFSSFVGKNDIIEKFWEIPFSKDVVLVGKFDRITETNMLLDWKTGKETPTYPILSSDPQFILYEWAYVKMFGTRPSTTLHVGLETLKMTKYIRKEELERTLLEETIPDIVNRIKYGVFPPNGLLMYHKHRPCWGCIYKEACTDELAGRDITT